MKPEDVPLLRYLNERGITLKDLIDTALELYVPHPGVETREKAAEILEEEFLDALSDVTFDVHQGEILGIIGPSGFNIKAYEIVLMGCRNNMKGLWWEGKNETYISDKVLNMLDAAHLSNRDFDTLSSGEQRKSLITKSLAQQTNIILLDEPVAFLDLRHKLEVMEVLRKLVQEGKTVIVTLHELELASKYCDKIIVLKDGRVVAAGRPRDIITEELIRVVYEVSARVKWDDELNYPSIMPRAPVKHGG